MAQRLGSFSQGGLGFGVAFTLEDNFSSAASAIQNSFNSLDANFASLSANIDASKAQMMGGLKTMGAGIAVLAPLYKGANIAGEMEQMSIAFEVMLKDADKAGKLLKDLRYFADVTPFATDDIIASGKMLVAFGQKAEEVIPTLNMLGNVAAGVNMPMKDLAEMYGKNLMQPNLQMRDIWQMSGRGIPIIRALADVLGVANDQVLKLVEDGKVGVPEMQKAFAAMGTGAGQFAGMMERQSTAYEGLKSTFLSYFRQVFEGIGVVLLPLMKEVFSVLTDWSKTIISVIQSPFGKWLVYTALGVGLLLTSFGLLNIALGAARWLSAQVAVRFGGLTLSSLIATVATKGLSAGLRQVGLAAWAATGPFVLIGIYIAGLIALFHALQPNTERNAKATLALAAAGFVLLGPLGALFSMFLLVKKSLAAFQEVNSADDLRGGAIGTLQKIGGWITGLVAVLQSWDSTTQTFSLDKELVERLGLVGVLDGVLAAATWIVRFYEMFKAFFEGVVDVFKGIWNDGIKPIFESIKSIFEPFIKLFEELFGAISIGKTTSAVSGWQRFGKTISWLVGVALWPLKAALWVVNMQIKFFAFIVNVVVEAIKLWVQWIVAVAGAIWDFVTGAVEAIGDFFSNIWQGFMDMLQWLIELPARAFQAGVDFVNQLWAGIKSIWGTFTGWLEGAWNDVLDFVGLGGDDSVSDTPSYRAASAFGRLNSDTAHLKGTDKIVAMQNKILIAANQGDAMAKGAKSEIEARYHVQLVADDKKLAELIMKQDGQKLLTAYE